jgi:hypothetical protein
MAAPALKVELGLDLGSNDPFAFRLDDAVKGVLDNTDFTLGGTKLFDISSRLVSVAVRRGKSQALDRVDAGVATITVDNFDRLFDPLYEAGLYYGQLIPRREVVISSNDYPVFNGFIDDFDIQYEPGKKSVVSIAVSDAFSVLANSSLDEVVPPSELSGARIERVLDLPEVSWPLERREIDPGNTLMLDSVVNEGTGTLSYDYLLERFKQPQYRFETVTVSLDNISAEQQNLVLDLEIGDIVQVKFLPSEVPPAIEQYCRVIGINNSWDNNSKNITFSLERLDFAIFILDDAVLGVLDDDRLAYE